MKIYDISPGGAAAAETSRSKDVQQTDRTGSGKSVAGAGVFQDRVQLSGTLGRLSIALSSSEADRANRVQSLAVQYQRGSYQPDSAAISRGMVGEALEPALQ